MRLARWRSNLAARARTPLAHSRGPRRPGAARRAERQAPAVATTPGQDALALRLARARRARLRRHADARGLAEVERLRRRRREGVAGAVGERAAVDDRDGQRAAAGEDLDGRAARQGAVGGGERRLPRAAPAPP